MISEDRTDASTIGIKNTYFIAEAYAMGGWAFIFPAVIIYALNFSMIYIFIVKLLDRIVVRNLEFNKNIVSYRGNGGWYLVFGRTATGTSKWLRHHQNPCCTQVRQNSWAYEGLRG